ncbi:flagellar filament capping protein FliD [Vreelandella janggokensis]|uniref:flagellar filament capping protein FliD n=1 Tax=Vreelandella janggokensis TaxID=370767 RepID=UPI00285572C7|nr:flagellar filament capping protein FliD [Halomonas janggokensis]MDR5887796.1 flagellar filament capping protein FliD [Halomonas janggokensis]
MATITSLGIGSGLDLNGLLDQLQDAERGKLAPITRQQEQQEAKISAYGKIQSSMDKFQDAVDALNDPKLYQSLSANVRGDEISATTDADALPGSYRVEVTALATAGTLASQRLDEGTESDDPLDMGDATQLRLAFTGQNSVNIDVAADSSLEDIRDAINAHENAGVSASVIFDGDGYRLALSSKETGLDASVSGFSFLKADGANATTQPLGAEAARAGQNASLDVNGITITSASNTIEEAIQGVTLNLGELSLGEGETASSTVNVERNTLKVREAIGDFVEAFNEVKNTIGTVTKFDNESGEAAELVGDSTVRTIEGRLRSVLTSGVAGGELATLSQLSISLQRDGTLEMDDAAVSDLAKNSPDALRDFFTGVEGNDASQGLASSLSTTLEQLMSKTGTLGNAISGAENRIDSLGERYERMESSIERTISRYRTQFGQLDAMIAQMNSTSSYLTQQFDALDAQLGRD